MGGRRLAEGLVVRTFTGGLASTGEDPQVRVECLVPDFAARGPASKGTHGQRNGPQEHPQRPGLVHIRNQTPRRCVEKMWVKMDDVEGRERTEGTLFTLLKLKGHQTKKAVEALQGDELTAFSQTAPWIWRRSRERRCAAPKWSGKGDEGCTRQVPSAGC